MEPTRPVMVAIAACRSRSCSIRRKRSEDRGVVDGLVEALRDLAEVARVSFLKAAARHLKAVAKHFNAVAKP
jgi:hypothetical protein